MQTKESRKNKLEMYKEISSSLMKLFKIGHLPDNIIHKQKHRAFITFQKNKHGVAIITVVCTQGEILLVIIISG